MVGTPELFPYVSNVASPSRWIAFANNSRFQWDPALEPYYPANIDTELSHPPPSSALRSYIMSTPGIDSSSQYPHTGALVSPPIRQNSSFVNNYDFHETDLSYDPEPRHLAPYPNLPHSMMTVSVENPYPRPTHEPVRLHMPKPLSPARFPTAFQYTDPRVLNLAANDGTWH